MSLAAMSPPSLSPLSPQALIGIEGPKDGNLIEEIHFYGLQEPLLVNREKAKKVIRIILPFKITFIHLRGDSVIHSGVIYGTHRPKIDTHMHKQTNMH